MEFFNQKDGFPFNHLPKSHFSPEYLQEIRNMVKQYNSVFNSEFWGTVHGLNTLKGRNLRIFPFELWECDEFLYLCLVVPGLSKIDDVKLNFHSHQIVSFKVKQRSMKPGGAKNLLKSELPQKEYEREIHLKTPIQTTDFSASYEDGVLVYTFKKVEAQLDIPADF
ncbi:Hsp20/alpha crystallin family protein [Bacillus sp. Marseille-P3661]|uniref:Hsp20/alpha crystallin family protein n=1 Tax=Bacillus sp. Marseille-P3661 TaxID=1936234 RepID=UPI000C832703|nr:Hsp20/alpha crystallin family protein [Bacillus sp. Marseille-P3661]